MSPGEVFRRPESRATSQQNILGSISVLLDFDHLQLVRLSEIHDAVRKAFQNCLCGVGTSRHYWLQIAMFDRTRKHSSRALGGFTAVVASQSLGHATGTDASAAVNVHLLNDEIINASQVGL